MAGATLEALLLARPGVADSCQAAEAGCCCLELDPGEGKNGLDLAASSNLEQKT